MPNDQLFSSHPESSVSSPLSNSERNPWKPQEEFEERGRRPTKLCVEHHLHHRGSKSQTLVLPPTSSPSSRRAVFPVPDQSGNPQGVTPEEAISESIGLPPPTSLVELALSPFEVYCQGVRGEGTLGRNSRPGNNETPPVVKINLSFLGFESVVGAASVVVGPSRQQQLRLTDMMHRDNSVAEQTAATVDRREGDESQKRRDDVGGGVVTETEVAPAPAPASPVTPPPLVILEEGSVLVRCPRCKACLPLGAAWDAHRDEHVSSLSEPAPAPAPTPASASALAAKSPLGTERRKRRGDTSPSPSPSRSPSVKRRSPLASSRMMTEMISPDEVGTGGGDGPESPVAIRGGMSAGEDLDPIVGKRKRLSDLLERAVRPSQAADVLRERGLLPADGRTRFAGVFLDSNPHSDK